MLRVVRMRAPSTTPLWKTIFTASRELIYFRHETMSTGLSSQQGLFYCVEKGEPEEWKRKGREGGIYS